MGQKITIGRNDYLTWGKLVKTWATGRNYVDYNPTEEDPVPTKQNGVRNIPGRNRSSSFSEQCRYGRCRPVLRWKQFTPVPREDQRRPDRAADRFRRLRSPGASQDNLLEPEARFLAARPINSRSTTRTIRRDPVPAEMATKVSKNDNSCAARRRIHAQYLRLKRAAFTTRRTRYSRPERRPRRDLRPGAPSLPGPRSERRATASAPCRRASAAAVAMPVGGDPLQRVLEFRLCFIEAADMGLGRAAPYCKGRRHPEFFAGCVDAPRIVGAEKLDRAGICDLRRLGHRRHPERCGGQRALIRAAIRTNLARCYQGPGIVLVEIDREPGMQGRFVHADRAVGRSTPG